MMLYVSLNLMKLPLCNFIYLMNDVFSVIYLSIIYKLFPYCFFPILKFDISLLFMTCLGYNGKKEHCYRDSVLDGS